MSCLYSIIKIYSSEIIIDNKEFKIAEIRLFRVYRKVK